jgi:hypothetical protein
MSEETDLQTEGAEGVTTPEAVETNAEATTAQPEAEAADSATADDAGEAIEEPVKKVPWFQKRIDEVTAKKYEAEREAAYWRGIAEASRTQPAEQQQVQVPDRWEDPEGYDKWLIQQAANAAREEMSNQQKVRSYEERETALRASKPDYDQVARDPTLPVTQSMAQVIWDSEKGPELLYHLGQNRSEAQRIAGLPSHLQAKELGRIEASLAAPPPQNRTVTPPPPPPKTVAGISAGINKSPDDMSMAEYVVWQRERDKT